MVKTNEWTTVSEMLANFPQFVKTGENTVLCSIHGEYIQTTYQNGRTTNCPACERERKEQRIAEEKAAQVREAEERKSRLINELLGKSGIPKRFQGKTLKNYQLSSPEQIEVFNDVVAFLNEFKAPQGHSGRCMTMLGNTGTGKSHLACAVALCIINTMAVQRDFPVFQKSTDWLENQKATTPNIQKRKLSKPLEITPC